MKQYPVADAAFASTLEKVLKTTREEVETFGYEVATELHCYRSNIWIHHNQMLQPATDEEGIAIVCFAAVLQFVNLLLATREV